jgi:DNA-binding LytR/AlgR family response regulator
MEKVFTCIIVDDEPAARSVLASHVEKIDALKLIGTCKNAIAAFAMINNEKVDLVFLDINMPEISGLSFAKSLNKSIKIIFTTAYREYALDGFDLQAVDYLLKPIPLARFIQAINTFLGTQFHTETALQTLLPETADFIFVRSERKMIKINFDAIQYIESLSDYIKIHTQEKTIVTRETISSIEAKLTKHAFLRIHRSYIVSVASIRSFTNEYVEIKNEALPISRSYKKQVLEFLSAI